MLGSGGIVLPNSTSPIAKTLKNNSWRAQTQGTECNPLDTALGCDKSMAVRWEQHQALRGANTQSPCLDSAAPLGAASPPSGHNLCRKELVSPLAHHHFQNLLPRKHFNTPTPPSWKSSKHCKLKGQTSELLGGGKTVRFLSIVLMEPSRNHTA